MARPTKAAQEAKAQAAQPAVNQPGGNVVLVRMQRDGKFADVHPLEVENYAKYDWVIVDGAHS